MRRRSWIFLHVTAVIFGKRIVGSESVTVDCAACGDIVLCKGLQGAALRIWNDVHLQELGMAVTADLEGDGDLCLVLAAPAPLA